MGRLSGRRGGREQKKQSRDYFHFLLCSRHEVMRSFSREVAGLGSRAWTGARRGTWEPSRCRRLEKSGASVDTGCLKDEACRMGTHTHGMREVNGFLLLSGVRGVMDKSIPEHSGLSFLIRTRVGVGKHGFAHLFYFGVSRSKLSIWIVWRGWGPELVRLLGVGSWVRGRGSTSVSEVHLPVCGTRGWLVCLQRATKLHFVCVRVRERERAGECGCARDGRPLVCLGCQWLRRGPVGSSIALGFFLRLTHTRLLLSLF